MTPLDFADQVVLRLGERGILAHVQLFNSLVCVMVDDNIVATVDDMMTRHFTPDQVADAILKALQED